MNKEIGGPSSINQVEQVKIESHKGFQRSIKESQDPNLNQQVKNVVIDELASLATDMIENRSEPSSVCKSFIKIAGTLNDRL